MQSIYYWLTARELRGVGLKFFKKITLFELTYSHYWLLARELRNIQHKFFSKLIDSIILPSVLVVINGYVLPHLGLPAEYGTFMLAGYAVLFSENTVYNCATELVADLNGPQAIIYELTLPVSYRFIYAKIAFSYAFKSVILNFWSIPISALLLGDMFDWQSVSVIKFFAMYIMINIFFAFIEIITALSFESLEEFGSFWIRWGWVLYALGCATFPWSVLYQVTPVGAYLNLLNPYVYLFEGMRSTVMEPTGLSFGFCFTVICLITIINAYVGMKWFKQRLDCI